MSEQVQALVACQPDIIALQEVTGTTQPLLHDLFRQSGYPFVVDNLDVAGAKSRNVLMVASSWQITRLVTDHHGSLPALTRPEAVLTAALQTPFGEIDLYNTHIPTTGNGQDIKLGMVDAFYQWLGSSTRQPRLVCGDFNMPRLETVEGELITFGQRLRKNGTFAVVNALEDRIERQIMLKLAEVDLLDVFRQVNGYTPQDSSWYAKNRGRAFGFRLDHIFASRILNPVSCRYLHDLRETGLSDHSALEATFIPTIP
jgi:exonuclease III